MRGCPGDRSAPTARRSIRSPLSACMTFKMVWKSTPEPVRYENPSQPFRFTGHRAECQLEAARSAATGFSWKSAGHIAGELRPDRRPNQRPIVPPDVTLKFSFRRLKNEVTEARTERLGHYPDRNWSVGDRRRPMGIRLGGAE